MRPFRSWTVSNKIIAPFLAVAVVGVVVGFFVLQDLIGNILDRGEEHEVAQSVEIVETSLSRNEDQLRLSAQLAAQAVGGRELALQNLGPIQTNFGLTQVYLTDSHGVVKGGRGNLPNVLPDGLEPLVREALKGKVGVSTLGLPWGITQWAAAPVVDQWGTAGAILVCKTLDPGALTAIKGSNNIELGTFFGGKLIGMTSPVLKSLDPSFFEREGTVNILYPGSAGEVPAKLLVRPMSIINGSGGFLIVKPNPEIVLARNRVFVLIGVGAAMLFLVLAATGLMIGRAITRPLSAMVQTTRNFASGDHADRVRLPDIPFIGRPDGADELAELVVAMNSMAAIIEGQIVTLNHSNQQIRHQMEQMSVMYTESILSLVTAVEARDPYTRGHSEHVALYSTWIAEEMGLDRDEIVLVTRAAQLHDIGKIGIVDAVLNKRDALDVSEKALIMKHPVIGYEIVRKSAALAPIASLVRHHHEWFTGGGYPDGLVGEQIPLGARIMAVADAFDAMTSTRPYRGPLPVDHALEVIRSDRMGQFDPRTAAAFIRVLENRPEARALVQTRAETVNASGTLANRDVITPSDQKEVLVTFQIIEQLRRIRELNSMLQCLANIVKVTLGYSRCTVALVDDSGERMLIKASAGYENNPLGEELALWKGIQGWAALQGEPVNIRDVSTDPRYTPLSGTTNSQLAIPIIVSNTIIGVLTVESDYRNAFTLDDVRVLQKMVEISGPAIEIIRAQDRPKSRWFPKVLKSEQK